MIEPIRRYAICEQGSNYIKCVMELPILSELKSNPELQEIYTRFIDPTITDEECLKIMSRMVEILKHKKPEKDLEIV